MKQLLSAVAVLLGAALTACGGTAAGPGATAPKGGRGVEAAALPYRIVDARTGRQVDEPAFWKALGAARAVCVGEDHPNPHHHWAQLRVVDALATGASIGLGLEMVQRPFQGVLDDWAARRIDDAALLSGTGWADRWGYDFAMYRPMLQAAVEAGGQVVALNAPRELTKKVSKGGLASLSAQEKAQLPELVLDDARHRAWFDGVMEAMGGASAHGDRADREGGTARAERIYSVQVLWDETMADGAARWLAAGAGRSMVILAGNGHCHDSAIVSRLRRRGVERVVSVRPIVDHGGELAEALAEPMTDYLFVMSMPGARGGS
jgi:uncharacterized iron-regulated protein